MKKTYFIGLLGAVVIILSCNSPSKEKSWNQEQEKAWKANCLALFDSMEVSRPVAEDHCDCIFKKTAEKYTPEEAAQITVEEERKIWEDCDYQW